ncbi:MAG: zinc ribbon domain-containing protein [Roseiflexus sp.]|nr:zinc ribbon domain-containing protein [Roseiflexus sp.]MBO9334989.1 zinc ribbon domain-containing protein [Roseiflexus sp.]MBO9341280.1 zinc ribbon domain-containing protein [Roseiflexus sp.]MBO9365370.1 zinc ribbon domain-containing protein [Roseiflexus sp.]MBO9381596.1 zinc ribbon domain-containing protein [Roseiflexus sp.]
MTETTVVCPHCRASVPADARYCIDCGAPMDNPVIEQTPPATGPTVQLPARPSDPAPVSIPASQPPTSSQTEWYDDLMIPLLLITAAVAMVTLPRFITFISIAVGVVGLLLSILRSIAARRMIAAAALAVAVGFFFSRRLFWAPLIIALITALLFRKRRPRIR